MLGAEPASETLATRAAHLFTAYRGGDVNRMGELVTLLTPILWHTARGQGLDRESAEDVVQTTWLSLVRRAETIADPAAVLQWLIVSTRREAWRVGKRTVRVERNEFEDDDVVTPLEQLPENVTLANDGQKRLWEHVGKLNDRCRALLRVIAFGDKPDYEGIAKALGMPVGSIGPTRGRCLAKLRTMLSSDPGWEN